MSGVEFMFFGTGWCAALAAEAVLERRWGAAVVNAALAFVVLTMAVTL